MAFDDLHAKLRLIERWIVRRGATGAPGWSPDLPDGFQRLRREHTVDAGRRPLPLDDLQRPLGSPLVGPTAPTEAQAVRARDLLFLDVETTGLSPGPRCQAFLVGLGWIEGACFVTEQFLLNHPRAEAEMLDALLPRLATAPGVVTFNGRTFDWVVLQARALHLGLPPPADPPLHLDLLHTARRIWRARAGSAALPVLEAQVLGKRRPASLPGWLIPSIYLDYLESGDGRVLAPVIDHNIEDVLTLPVLLAATQRALEVPQDLEFPLDLVGVGSAHEAAGGYAHAQEAYAAALERGLDAAYRLRAAARLARLYQREGRPKAAIRLWEAEIAGALQASVEARVALAKLYEHRARDCAAAYRVALEALDLLSAQPAPVPVPVPERVVADLIRRLDRLDRRMAKEHAGDRP